jgi:hypothetical protein
MRQFVHDVGRPRFIFGWADKYSNSGWTEDAQHLIEQPRQRG